MRERALIHVGGPKGAGKTAFIEQILGSAGEWMFAARCVRDDSLRRARETSPKSHLEIRQSREAGAAGAALFTFPESDIGSDAFFRFVTGEVDRLDVPKAETKQADGDRMSAVEKELLATYRRLPPNYQRRLREHARELEVLARAAAKKD